MATVERVIIEITGDTKGLKPTVKVLKEVGAVNEKNAKSFQKTQKAARVEIKKTESSLGGLGKIASRIGPAIVGAFAIGSLVSFAKGLKDTAVQMEAFRNRANVVFGDAVKFVQEFAKENARSLGLTENAFLGAAAAVGDILVPLGLTRDRAAEMSSEAVKLGAALKEFTGDQRSAAEISEVVAKSFTGELEGLKGLGVVINQNSKEFKDLKLSKQIDLGLTEDQAKAETIFELVLQKSNDALVSFEGNSESLTRQQAELEASTGELTEALATLLTPALNAATTSLAKTAGALADVVTDDNITGIQKFSGAVILLALGAQDAAEGMEDLAENTEEADKNLSNFLTKFKNLGKTVPESTVTLEKLSKQLSDNKNELKKAAIGSDEFNRIQKEGVAIQKQIDTALGKNIKALSKKEKAIREELKALRELGPVQLQTNFQLVEEVKTTRQLEKELQDLIDARKKLTASEDELAAAQKRRATENEEIIGQELEVNELLDGQAGLFGDLFDAIQTGGASFIESAAGIQSLVAAYEAVVDAITGVQQSLQNVAELEADTEKTLALNAIRRREDAELEGKTEEQKAEIREKFEKEREIIEREAFERGKELAIKQINIDKSQAILKALSRGLVGAAQIPFIEKQAAAQIANVEAQQFAEGTGFVKPLNELQGKKTDDIPAMLTKGEGVATVHGNKKYSGLVGAINDDRVADWFAMNPQVMAQTGNMWTDENIVRKASETNRILKGLSSQLTYQQRMRRIQRGWR